MIVLERDKDFILIKQHDHAALSGQMVREWKQNFLLRSKLREEADWAAAQHDRAWIPLDDEPRWNEEEGRPYSFIDYPLEEKLAAYQRGIEEVAGQSLYAGMLCSMHYQSFLSEDSENPVIRQFVQEEKERQEDLFASMEMDVPKDIYDLHFKRLQFCDDLSLYVCMNQPGTSKEQEVSWFKDGFRQAFDFAPEGMIAHWVDDKQVSVDPFPFENPFDAQVPYKLVRKSSIDRLGFTEAYKQAETDQRLITFIPAE
ncbi:DUF3891 family protein [Halobacillus litoralis]|uniref:DUF3891 family protein n=1 Tax=Halobacillus litoralis TaxID=45668 RepID=UPI001CD6C26F|nr:DUF3891 family protein [Halobacillus litoralis]MCA0972389.1 DUF3891 family protein [Halobacillus litoralis]